MSRVRHERKSNTELSVPLAKKFMSSLPSILRIGLSKVISGIVSSISVPPIIPLGLS